VERRPGRRRGRGDPVPAGGPDRRARRPVVRLRGLRVRMGLRARQYQQRLADDRRLHPRRRLRPAAGARLSSLVAMVNALEEFAQIEEAGWAREMLGRLGRVRATYGPVIRGFVSYPFAEIWKSEQISARSRLTISMPELWFFHQGDKT